jgi:hypothetical protein
VVGAFDCACADDDYVAMNGRRRFDVKWGLDLPVKLTGVGVEADEIAVGVVVKALADEEELAIGGEGGGGEEGFEVLVIQLIDFPDLRTVGAVKAED